MLDKELCCLIAQAIYKDHFLAVTGQGPLRQHLSHRTVEFHKIFFARRYPSALRTTQNHRNLAVVSEDELECVVTALAGTQLISVVLFQVQGHVQENIVQLYHTAEKLWRVCLFHECFVNATSVDLITAVCTSLRRHLSQVHSVAKYRNFSYAPTGQMKEITKSIYFIVFHSAFTTGSFEVVSPCIEYSETWSCNSSVLTPKIHEEIKSIPGIFLFRLHKNEVPFQATLGVTDRCCITFCISESKLDNVAGTLESIYQYLKIEVVGLEKQELQRIIPLFWSGSKCATPAFFQHECVAFLDVRHCVKKQTSKQDSRGSYLNGHTLSFSKEVHYGALCVWSTS